MAIGTELYLGISGLSAIDAAALSVGLQYDWDTGDFYPEDKAQEIQAALNAAHEKALSELGLELIDPARIERGGQPVDPEYLYVKGLDGIIRQTCRWGLAVDYDPDEMGETTSHALIGVSLISRLFPCLFRLGPGARWIWRTYYLVPACPPTNRDSPQAHRGCLAIYRGGSNHNQAATLLTPDP